MGQKMLKKMCNIAVIHFFNHSSRTVLLIRRWDLLSAKCLFPFITDPYLLIHASDKIKTLIYSTSIDFLLLPPREGLRESRERKS